MDDAHTGDMTTTTANATTTAAIGTCGFSGHTFRAEGAERPYYCPECEPHITTAYGQPWVQRSTIKWATVKARVTRTECDSACTSAKGSKCSCECGGHNHGMVWAR